MLQSKANPNSDPRYNFLAILLLLAITAVMSHAAQTDQNGANAPTRQITPDLKADARVDVAAMDKYEAAVRNMLNERQFVQLDQLAASLRTSKSRFAGGTWKLFIFYRGLKQPAGGYAAPDSAWASHLENLTMWAAGNPKSVTAWVALAEATEEYAGKARHDAKAPATPGENPEERDPGPLVSNRIHQAKLALQEAAKLETKCPHYYFVKQKIFRAPNAALLQEARTFEPTYYYYYRMQGLLLYLYSADPEATLKFAEKTAADVGGDEGKVAYYEIAAAINGNGGNLPWPPAKFPWDKVQAGYSALEKLYGPSLFKANQMAYMAIQLKDTLSARQFFARIGNQWDPEVWGTREYFEVSRDWSSSSPDFAAALEIASGNNKTQSGQSYFQVASQQLNVAARPAWRSCIQPQSGLKGNFDLLLQVAADGTIEKTKVWPQTPASTCLASALVSRKLPAPPNVSYWIRIPIVSEYQDYPSGQVKTEQ